MVEIALDLSEALVARLRELSRAEGKTLGELVGEAVLERRGPSVVGAV